jgi:hypothetical protein
LELVPSLSVAGLRQDLAGSALQAKAFATDNADFQGEQGVVATLLTSWATLGSEAMELARLLSLDESVIEAAKIDGAGWWHRLWHIILPEMRGVIEFYVVVSVITMLAAVFSYIYIMGGGRGGLALGRVARSPARSRRLRALRRWDCVAFLRPRSLRRTLARAGADCISPSDFTAVARGVRLARAT